MIISYKKYSRGSTYCRILNCESKARELHDPIYDESKGETICCRCGLVLDEREIREDLPPRIFNEEQKNNRKHHGTPITPLLPDMQFSTMVLRGKCTNPSLKKALRWDTRYDWHQRNLMQAISEIKRLGTHLNEPRRVQEYASQVYRKAQDLGLLKGRSIRAMAAACLYFAGNKERIPTPLHEIKEHSNVETRDIVVCYQSILKRLRLKSPVMDPQFMISKPIASLNLPHEVEMDTHRIVQIYKKLYNMSGKDPKGIVAASIYYSVKRRGLSVLQYKLVEELGITEVTMRKRYKEIQKMMRAIYAAKKKREKKEKTEEKLVQTTY